MRSSIVLLDKRRWFWEHDRWWRYRLWWINLIIVFKTFFKTLHLVFFWNIEKFPAFFKHQCTIVVPHCNDMFVSMMYDKSSPPIATHLHPQSLFLRSETLVPAACNVPASSKVIVACVVPAVTSISLLYTRLEEATRDTSSITPPHTSPSHSPYTTFPHMGSNLLY